MTGSASHPTDWSLEIATRCWPTVCEHLCTEVGETLFDRFLRPLSVTGTGPDRVIMAAPTKFMRSWILQNFGDHLHRAWRTQHTHVAAVELTVADAQLPAARLSSGGAAGQTAGEPAAHLPASARTGERASEDIQPEGENSTFFGYSGGDATGLNPELTFDSYVTGTSNALAHQAAKRLAEHDHTLFHTLYMFGPTGVGKTHLVHALGNALKKRHPRARIRYLSAEQFLRRFVGAIRGNATLAFKDEFRSLDLLLIDDVQFIARKESTQEEFFHTLNTLLTDNRRIVITADCAPGELEGFHERIRTRLSGGMIVDIGATDAALRLDILRARVPRLTRTLMAMGRPEPVFEPGVLEFLAENVKSNVRVLDGAFNSVVTEADFKGIPVSIALAQSLLRDVLGVQEKAVTVDHITQITADYYGLKAAELKSERRTKPIVTARHVAQWLARNMTDRSYPRIAQRFGNRDHATIIHAVRKIDDLRVRDPQLKADLEALMKLIKS